MKQVWILNHYAQEPGGAGGTRHFSLAKHLFAQGWSSTLIAASVELNTGRQRLQENEQCRLDHFDSVPFLWVKTPQYEGNGGGRMTNMLAYAFKVLLPRTTKNLPKPDVVIGSSVHPFAAFAGALLAKRHSVPFVFEVRDLWPQTLVDLGRLSDKSIVTKCLRWLELWLYKRAEKIVVLLPNAVDYISSLGIPAAKVVWIPNGVELEGYSKPVPPVINGTFTLMYFGAHGQANGLDTLLHAMKKVQKVLPDNKLQLRMVGDGPMKPELIELAVKLDLKSVIFEKSVDKKNIPLLASQADAFVITVLNIPNLYRYGISMNKLFDYLAAGRPIIMASNASNNPVDDAGAGLTISPGDPDKLAAAIIQIFNTPVEERLRFGLAGRKYVEQNHDYKFLAKNLSELLESCTLDYKVSNQ